MNFSVDGDDVITATVDSSPRLRIAPSVIFRLAIDKPKSGFATMDRREVGNAD